MHRRSRWLSSRFRIEAVGRLAEPMSYDPVADRYVPISWDDAFTLVGSALRELESPDQASFYTSGRLSNEATFLYQFWVREFGTNNLPDCSNMCHEASGRGLTAAIGTGKGTVDLHDWAAADAIWLMADNAATNAPRMLTWLADSYIASKRLIVAWCLGVTQHEHGVDTVREIVNLMLLGGHIGCPGAGPCPVRAWPAGADSALPGPHREGSADERRTGHHRRGLDVDRAHLPRDEEAGLASSP
jgi:anaerobic selenocysteine-containing dehydrogenase